MYCGQQRDLVYHTYNMLSYSVRYRIRALLHLSEASFTSRTAEAKTQATVRNTADNHYSVCIHFNTQDKMCVFNTIFDRF